MPLPKLSKAGSISYISGKLKFPCSLFEDFRVRLFQHSKRRIAISQRTHRIGNCSQKPNDDAAWSKARSPTEASQSRGGFWPYIRVLREIRKSRSLSQEELGARSGYHRTYIGLLVRGEKSPPCGRSSILQKHWSRVLLQS